MNIYSLNKIFDKLVYVIQNCKIKFHIIILSETWISDEFNYILNGYLGVNEPGLSRCNGNRISMFVKDNLTIKSINKYKILEANTIILNIQLPHESESITVIALFWSPSTSINTFLDSLRVFTIFEN